MDSNAHLEEREREREKKKKGDFGIHEDTSSKRTHGGCSFLNRFPCLVLFILCLLLFVCAISWLHSMHALFSRFLCLLSIFHS